MCAKIRAARSGDGVGLARIWLDNARYYVALFPDDFRVPDEDGLVDWLKALLARPRAKSELHLVAVSDGKVAAFVYARLSEPDEHANRQMLGEYPFTWRPSERRTPSSAAGLRRSWWRPSKPGRASVVHAQ